MGKYGACVLGSDSNNIAAVVIAARFSGIVLKRSLKRLAAIEVDAKDKEIIFLRDMVEKLQMQVSILQKRDQEETEEASKMWLLWETYFPKVTFATAAQFSLLFQITPNFILM